MSLMYVAKASKLPRPTGYGGQWRGAVSQPIGYEKDSFPFFSVLSLDHLAFASRVSFLRLW
jgi:hypothetical protein